MRILGKVLYIPYSNISKSTKFEYTNGSYVCGLNAANKCLKMWGYKNSVSKSQYPYNYVWFLWFKSDPYGPVGMQYTRFLQKHFKTSYVGWNIRYKSSSTMDWDFLDSTNYRLYSVIVLCSWGKVAHYAIIIGVSKDKKWYMITDQTDTIYYIHCDKLRWLLDCSWIPTPIGGNGGNGESTPKYALYRVE